MSVSIQLQSHSHVPHSSLLLYHTKSKNPDTYSIGASQAMPVSTTFLPPQYRSGRGGIPLIEATGSLLVHPIARGRLITPAMHIYYTTCSKIQTESLSRPALSGFGVFFRFRLRFLLRTLIQRRYQPRCGAASTLFHQTRRRDRLPLPLRSRCNHFRDWHRSSPRQECTISARRRP